MRTLIEHYTVFDLRAVEINSQKSSYLSFCLFYSIFLYGFNHSTGPELYAKTCRKLENLDKEK